MSTGDQRNRLTPTAVLQHQSEFFCLQSVAWLTWPQTPATSAPSHTGSRVSGCINRLPAIALALAFASIFWRFSALSFAQALFHCEHQHRYLSGKAATRPRHSGKDNNQLRVNFNDVVSVSNWSSTADRYATMPPTVKLTCIIGHHLEQAALTFCNICGRADLIALRVWAVDWLALALRPAIPFPVTPGETVTAVIPAPNSFFKLHQFSVAALQPE